MGSILERMKQLGEKRGSYREVARRMLKSRHWPKGDTLDAAALAVYLAKLDQDGYSKGLDERPASRKALAEVLDLEPEDLEEHLRGGARKPAPASEVRIPLEDLDAPFDLRTEPLPPGLPPQATDPRQWPRWWQAPSGSGRSLVGRWLEARRLATFISAESWAEAEQRLPARGAVFVELTRSAGTSLPPLEPPANLAICIAADEPPPTPPVDTERSLVFPGSSVGTAWPLAQPEPVESWLEPLVHWAAERLPRERGFRPDACLRWLRDVPLAQGLVDGFGAALGFIGLFAEFGDRRFARGAGRLEQTRELTGLARLFLRLRLKRAESPTLTHKALWEGLLRLARGLLTRSDRDWAEPRTLEAWHALAGARPDATDLRWVEALSASGRLKPEAAEALKQAASGLPPDVFRAVQALRELKMLREEAPRLFTVRPRWFLDALVEEAAHGLLDEGPTAWGAALLRQHGAALVLERLIARCHQKDFAPIQKVLEDPAPRRPEWVAALEGAFRALGLTLLERGAVPESLRHEVLLQQLPLLVERWKEHPVPRIGYEHTWSRRWPVLERGTWYLAAFALAETLGARLPASASRVMPWRGDMSPECLQNLLGEITHVGVDRDGLEESRQLGALELGGRLLRALGPIRTNLAPIGELQLPEWLLRRFQAGELAFDDLRDDLRLQQVLRLMPAYVERQDVSWDAMARALWKVWLDSLGPEHKEMPQLFWLEQPWTSALWRALPVDATEVLVTRYAGVLSHRPMAFAYFRPEHWRVFFRSWRKVRDGVNHSLSTESFWRWVPPDVLRELLRGGVLTRYDHAAREELWRRIPTAVIEDLGLLIDAGRWEEVFDLAWAPPPERAAEVIPRVEAGLSRADVPRALLVGWAYEWVARRAPGWPRVWELLEGLSGTGS